MTMLRAKVKTGFRPPTTQKPRPGVDLKRRKLGSGSQSKGKRSRLSEVWSPADTSAVNLLKPILRNSDRTKSIRIGSRDALVQLFNKHIELKNNDTETDFVVAYATVIAANDNKTREILFESVCMVLGRARYSNSNLFSLVLQAMGHPPDASSKRGVIARFALARGVRPSRLTEFVEGRGGIEGCVSQARDFATLQHGNLEVALVMRSGLSCKALLAFEEKTLAQVALMVFRNLPIEAQKTCSFTDATVLNHLTKDLALG